MPRAGWPDAPGALDQRHQLGLDRPLWVQYGHFATSLLRGDLGHSFYYRTPVLELYLSRLPHSLLLAAAAMAFSLLVGIPSGILAAVRVNQWWDSAGKIFALLGLSLPSFWVGLVMILFFSVYLGWLPSSGSGTALHVIMPAFALGWYFAAAHMRLTRSAMLEVLGSEYVKLARLKGLPEALVIAKHAFKNALIPVMTLAGTSLSASRTLNHVALLWSSTIARTRSLSTKPSRQDVRVIAEQLCRFPEMSSVMPRTWSA